ncbi:MAG: hypothetical protein ABF539_06700 [Liquorilactobacillus nagelii]|jgi:hypothetical protein|nr:hypothetical protein [Liquorilactobacillus nagelii]
MKKKCFCGLILATATAIVACKTVKYMKIGQGDDLNAYAKYNS